MSRGKEPGAQQPFPREDGAYPSLLKELLAEPPRPLVFSGPSEAGSGLAHGLPELLAGPLRVSARPENREDIFRRVVMPRHCRV